MKRNKRQSEGNANEEINWDSKRICIDIEPESLVGHHVKIWWDGDQCAYPGKVESFDISTWRHKVVYDDGECRDELLVQERVMVPRAKGHQTIVWPQPTSQQLVALGALLTQTLDELEAEIAAKGARSGTARSRSLEGTTKAKNLRQIVQSVMAKADEVEAQELEDQIKAQSQKEPKEIPSSDREKPPHRSGSVHKDLSTVPPVEEDKVVKGQHARGARQRQPPQSSKGRTAGRANKGAKGAVQEQAPQSTKVTRPKAMSKASRVASENAVSNTAEVLTPPDDLPEPEALHTEAIDDPVAQSPANKAPVVVSTTKANNNSSEPLSDNLMMKGPDDPIPPEVPSKVEPKEKSSRPLGARGRIRFKGRKKQAPAAVEEMEDDSLTKTLQEGAQQARLVVEEPQKLDEQVQQIMVEEQQQQQQQQQQNVEQIQHQSVKEQHQIDHVQMVENSAKCDDSGVVVPTAVEDAVGIYIQQQWPTSTMANASQGAIIQVQGKRGRGRPKKEKTVETVCITPEEPLEAGPRPKRQQQQQQDKKWQLPEAKCLSVIDGQNEIEPPKPQASNLQGAEGQEPEQNDTTFNAVSSAAAVEAVAEAVAILNAGAISLDPEFSTVPNSDQLKQADMVGRSPLEIFDGTQAHQANDGSAGVLSSSRLKEILLKSASVLKSGDPKSHHNTPSEPSNARPKRQKSESLISGEQLVLETYQDSTELLDWVSGVVSPEILTQFKIWGERLSSVISDVPLPNMPPGSKLVPMQDALDIMKALEHQAVNLALLEESQICKSVAMLRSHRNLKIANQANHLVGVWRRIPAEVLQRANAILAMGTAKKSRLSGRT